MMEENGADVIEMAVQGKETPSSLIRPDLDLVIITAGDEEGLGLMEIDTSDGTVVLLESIYQGTHTIVPELDGGRVEGDENPWSDAQ